MNDFSANFHPNKTDTSLHIGLVPDGGRRWAKKNNVSLRESYAVTRDLLQDLAKYFFSQGVSELSIYLSSAQNFRRSKAEISSFTEVTSKALSNEIINLAMLLNLRINIVGNSDSIPDYIKSSLLENNMKFDDQYVGTINLCIAYNPIEEIINAIKLSSSANDFLDYLWVKKPLDLIIRSGGANLTSNFLPLQSGFARLYFLDELFNDVSLGSVKNIMKEFLSLNRKFGD